MSATGTPLKLEGVVRAGLGEGARFTAIDWVAEAFRARLGFAPWPGTFNLRMRGPAWEAARTQLRRAAGVAITPPAGFCAAKCFAVGIAGKCVGAVVLPDMPDYPADKLEIVAPLSLREALGLRDGDRVQLEVSTDGGIFPLPPGTVATHPCIEQPHDTAHAPASAGD